MCLLEELDGNFSSNDPEAVGVGLLEQLAEGAFLIGSEIEDWVICCPVSALSYASASRNRLRSPPASDILTCSQGMINVTSWRVPGRGVCNVQDPRDPRNYLRSSNDGRSRFVNRAIRVWEYRTRLEWRS